jgi:hypothetical protein
VTRPVLLRALGPDPQNEADALGNGSIDDRENLLFGTRACQGIRQKTREIDHANDHAGAQKAQQNVNLARLDTICVV